MGAQEPSAALLAAADLGSAPEAATREQPRGRLDEETFRALHAAAARPLWAYLAGAGGDPALADDLVQESFLRVLRAPGAPRDPAHLRAYLFRTATNLLHDHRRRRRGTDGPPAETAVAAAAAPRAPAGLRGDLQRLLSRLDPRARRLLWLAHVEGESHAEIAVATGLRETSVRVLLFRARRRLAGELRAAGYSEKGL
jgi:RNA polymerase sigma-70 factor, ECF subfamily